MVRIVSVSTLGYDEYGGYFNDRSVDGVDYSDEAGKREALQVKQDPVKKASKPVKLLGGKKV